MARVERSGYNHNQIEPRWQLVWEEKRLFSPKMKSAKKPFYNLMMFPYPSAEGLHVGNMYAFTGADVYGRFRRMKGDDVFEPIGLDGFGIHSENYALKVNRHPKKQARLSEKNFYRQLRAIGNSYDWQRTLETYDPDYYRWTQWIFVKLFKAGLAYKKKAPVNWCPSCKTVLADEQVVKKNPGPRTQNLEPKTSLSDPSPIRRGKGEVNMESVNVCERCETKVSTKELSQWFFRIASGQRPDGTAYPDALLNNLKQIDWVEKVKIGQRNWIGRKEGINIRYRVMVEDGVTEHIVCFTTRPDTNFGATFIVVGPEHPFVASLPNSKFQIPNSKLKEIRVYVERAKKKTQPERIAEGAKKTGVFSGFYAINDLNGEKMPIWVSDFVLGDVGTGAVVGVPGHDRRDFQFAKTFGLPIKRIVIGSDGDTSPITREEQVQEDEGVMINSEFLNGLDIHKAIKKMMDYLEEKGWGKRMVHYHLRDWLISRQRYWGAPIPMIYCQSCAEEGVGWFSLYGQAKPQNTPGVAGRSASRSHDSPGVGESNLMPGWFPIPEEELPVLLPDVKDWKPTGTGKAPLASVPEFAKTTCSNCGAQAERETDVCDTFLDSSWYFLRYPSVGEDTTGVTRPVRRSLGAGGRGSPGVEGTGDEVKGKGSLPWNHEITKKWLPVNMYIGGAEHTVLHLLYARFITMALCDLGYLHFEEPFSRFYAHGLIIKEGAKMSKSRGNIVVPDDYIKKYGVDALRTYLMFLGPFDQGGDFRDTGIVGMYRFLRRVWRLVSQYLESESGKDTMGVTQRGSSEVERVNQALARFMHQTIKSVTLDLENLRYNTAIAHIMEYVNKMSKGTRQKSNVPKQAIETLLLLLAPFTPHLTEELWQQIKHVQREKNFSSIHFHSWPSYDPKLVEAEEVTIVVQINGKKRDTLKVKSREAQVKSEIEEAAKKSAKVKRYLAEKKIRQVIFVPGKLVNFVV